MSMRMAALCLAGALAAWLLEVPAKAQGCGPGFEGGCELWCPDPNPRVTEPSLTCKWVCTCAGIPQRGTAIPKFHVTHVVYAVPGSESSVTYGAGKTWGSTTSTTDSWKAGTEVSAGINLSAPSIIEEIGDLQGGATLTSGKGWGSTSTRTTDIEVSLTRDKSFPGQSDLVDHDEDRIYFLVKPKLSVTVTPKWPSGFFVDWEFAPGQALKQTYVAVRWLKHPCTMPPNVRERLTREGITPEDYPKLLAADPFAYERTAPAVGSPEFSKRFVKQDNFPYNPRTGNPASETEMISRKDTTSDEQSTHYSYTVSMELEGGVEFLGAINLSLSRKDTLTFEHTESRTTTTGKSTEDTFTVTEPFPLYDGPTCVDVYLDRVWKSYLFVLPDECAGTLAACSEEGGKVCERAGASRCEARWGQHELCRWEGATEHSWQALPPIYCGPTVPTPFTAIQCDPQYGIWTPADDPFAVGNPGSVSNPGGSCITQTPNLCRSASFATCMWHGATSCEKISHTNGSRFDLCRWKNVGESQCGTVAGPGPGGNRGIWTGASDSFAINSPGSVQDGNGACITQVTNLPAHGISVVAGTYGGNCGATHGNDSGALARACDSLGRCDYVVDFTVIGDPVPGCGKDYVAEWMCEGSTFVRRATASPEAGFGKTVSLTCP